MLHRAEQRILGDGLGEKIRGTLFEGADARGDIPVTGYKNDRERVAAGFEHFLKVQPAGAPHAKVQQQTGRRFAQVRH